MWCPHCNQEYDETFQQCLVCGGDLVAYTPILTDSQRAVLELDEQQEQNVPENTMAEEAMPELLATVIGEDARDLVDRLQALRIPCLCRPGEDAEFALTEGEPVYDILVPKKMIAKALAILAEEEAESEPLQAEEFCNDLEDTVAGEQPVKSEKEKSEKKKKWLGFFGKKD